MPNVENSIIEEVIFSGLKQKKCSLYIKREDLIHPYVSGNKYRKLKYNIEQAKVDKKQLLLTFGGAYSNHIAAVASVGKKNKFETIGVIRGEELADNLQNTLETNPTLRFAHDCGMKFKFVSREAYRDKSSECFIANLKNEFGDFFLIPEGGTNELAVKGCEEILSSDTEQFDFICISVGTGGTISGIINSAKKHQKVIGFPALKGEFLVDEIKKWAHLDSNWELNTDYHFGGYAKTTNELIEFINYFKQETKIQLDPIYTGKMVFGVVDLINKDYFAEGSRILLVHTGGIQGIEGVNSILKRKNKILISK
jgi:1-aminocyclopropane-1-carboxylate deaminase|tara:strand:+ start:584 stop:1516 length:933 start_codon:yes stop_codon:yes gene_type:complete